jgi:hypothetical protein
MLQDRGGKAMWVFLTSVTTEIEADILIGLLHQEGIPTRKIYPGIGNLKATYGLISGVEIYVPDAMRLKAKELLGSDAEMNEYTECEGSEE